MGCNGLVDGGADIRMGRGGGVLALVSMIVI